MEPQKLSHDKAWNENTAIATSIKGQRVWPMIFQRESIECIQRLREGFCERARKAGPVVDIQFVFTQFLK